MPDVYYRPAYALAYEEAGYGRAAAVTLRTPKFEFLIPLLLTSVCDLPFAHRISGLDAVTPYGYGGILVIPGAEEPDPETGAAIIHELRNVCLNQGIISCFLRLHPLSSQERWLASVESINAGFRLASFGSTIALDLTKWNDAATWHSGMSKGRRSDLNFARRRLRVTWTQGTDVSVRFYPTVSDLPNGHLTLFQEIYHATMHRRGANSFYYFPEAYYRSLVSRLGQHSAIAIAWLGDEAVGGALFLRDNLYAHYHLSGATERGNASKSSTLLICEGARWARDSGCTTLHLGGGRGGTKDSLFAFKQSFGGLSRTCYFATLVICPQRYEKLTHLRSVDQNLPPVREDFFPTYRA